jgi:hypothetical protein
MAVLKQKTLEVVSKTGGRVCRTKAASPRCAGNGVKTLREAAGKTVEENSAKIAKQLLTQALAGDFKCTQLLLSLAEQEPGQDEEASQPQRNWSMALALASEPEWRGGNTAETAKLGTGGRAVAI